jgi:hypothetical protein
LLAVIVIATCVGCARNRGFVSIRNNSREQIARASVRVCGQTLEAKNLRPNGSAPLEYRVTGESGFSVEVEFASGRRLSTRTVNNVTEGFDFRHYIVVTTDAISLTGGPEQPGA